MWYYDISPFPHSLNHDKKGIVGYSYVNSFVWRFVLMYDVRVWFLWVLMSALVGYSIELDAHLCCPVTPIFVRRKIDMSWFEFVLLVWLGLVHLIVV